MWSRAIQDAAKADGEDIPGLTMAIAPDQGESAPSAEALLIARQQRSRHCTDQQTTPPAEPLPPALDHSGTPHGIPEPPDL
jgi:hypothetical protein